jgi:hypothetical protein
MKYTHLTLLVLSGLLLQNCGDKGDVDTKSYNTIEIQKDFLLGDVPELQFEILDTINLNAPGNPPLTGIQDMAFSQDFFLLLDVRQGLLKFDYEGNLLRAIGAMGEGPEEYLQPRAIYLDEKENIVLVTDGMKMVVLSYDLEGNFNSSSQRLPGLPISLYNENDTLLVIQESIFGSNAEPRQVLLSSIEPKTLEVKHQESPLYGYDSDFTIIHAIPRILSRVNEASLFYLPIIWEHPSEHRNKDTSTEKWKIIWFRNTYLTSPDLTMQISWV